MKPRQQTSAAAWWRRPSQHLTRLERHEISWLLIALAGSILTSTSAWFVTYSLKNSFERTRPTAVPHLRDVASPSFPSGHALTSAVVYLTLGAVLMHVSKGRITKIYCLTAAMMLTLLAGISRVCLGVHYPTDVIAG
jgi:membrane-associated phospholipid phosphatase